MYAVSFCVILRTVLRRCDCNRQIGISLLLCVFLLSGISHASGQSVIVVSPQMSIGSNGKHKEPVGHGFVLGMQDVKIDLSRAGVSSEKPVCSNAIVGFPARSSAHVESLPTWITRMPGPHRYASVVLDSKRIVMVLNDQPSESGGVFNHMLPIVVYSDDGHDWKPDPVGGMGIPVLIAGYSSIDASTTDTTGVGDTPWRVDRRKHAPSIAVDHNTMPDDVYVAFVARSAQGSTNTDLYISRSVAAESAISFPTNTLNFLHLTDSMLGLTGNAANADQFVPAIAVDGCGDLNIMFYDNRNDPDLTDSIELVDVYFAHITGFGTATPTITQRRLTPVSFRVDNLGQNGEPGFLGDYQTLAVAANGKTIYAAYIARDPADPVNGTVGCYAHRIVVKCPGLLADISGDGTVDQTDADQFMAAFDAHDLRADVDLDWDVDADDLLTFTGWFNQEHQ